jgi:hypothetical protein
MRSQKFIVSAVVEHYRIKNRSSDNTQTRKNSWLIAALDRTIMSHKL